MQFTGERLIPEVNKGYAFFYEHLARYLFSSQFVTGKVVLDAGCGSGYGSSILVSQGKAQKVYGIDLSSEAITYAKEHYGQDGITFTMDNVEEMETIDKNSIDVVVSFELIEHIKNQNTFLNQVKRVLKPGGLFIVSTPNKYNYPEGNHFHVNELYPEEFEQELQKHFKNTSLLLQDFDFAQIIKQLKPTAIKIEEEFVPTGMLNYVAPATIKTAQYILCICSDDKLPDYQLVGLTANNVDNFDLTQGLLTLNEQFQNIRKQLAASSKQAKDHEDYVFILKEEVEKRERIIQSLHAELATLKSTRLVQLALSLNSTRPNRRKSK